MNAGVVVLVLVAISIALNVVDAIFDARRRRRQRKALAQWYAENERQQ